MIQTNQTISLYFTRLAPTTRLQLLPTTRVRMRACAWLAAMEGNGIRITAPVTIMTRYYGVLILYPVSWKRIVLFCRINSGVPTLMKSYGSNLGVIEIKWDRLYLRWYNFNTPTSSPYLFVRGNTSPRYLISRKIPRSRHVFSLALAANPSP